MKLSKFIELSGISSSLFAKKIGAKSRMTVKRYVDGTRVPTQDFLDRIEVETNGLVTANDFVTEAEVRKHQEKEIKKYHAHEESKSQLSKTVRVGGLNHSHSEKKKKETSTTYENCKSKQKSNFIQQLLNGLDGQARKEHEQKVIQNLREDGAFDDDWKKTRHLNRPNPIEEALSILGPRVSIERHSYFLDERPASIPMIIQAANKTRRKLGLTPLVYPGV